MLTDIFIIRHAQPTQFMGQNYNLPPGPDLSERGRDEALQAARFLADKGLQHLFVSPFARTTQTAEIVHEQLDIPITFTRLVAEHAPHEDQAQVRTRIQELLAAADDAQATCIGIISHGSPIKQLLLELTQERINLSQHTYAGGNPAPTAGIWHAQRRDNRWNLALVFTPT